MFYAQSTITVILKWTWHDEWTLTHTNSPRGWSHELPNQEQWNEDGMMSEHTHKQHMRASIKWRKWQRGSHPNSKHQITSFLQQLLWHNATGLPKLSTDNFSLVLKRQHFCNHEDNSNYTGPHFSYNYSGMLQYSVACTVCVCVCVH